MPSLAPHSSQIQRQLLKAMSSTGGLSYSATLSQGLAATSKHVSTAPSQAQQAQSHDQSSAQRNRGQQASHTDKPNHDNPEAQRKRQPSPSHIPQTGNEEQNVYVLTLLTDKPLHERMTDLRKRYFPKKINKLAAHLTLFHALPESKLESKIIPTLLEVTKSTSPFRVEATEPFRLKKGFAISVSGQHGGSQARAIHQQLQEAWSGEGWLSQQDAGGCRVHYTLMNKVDDESEVQNALDEVKSFWKGDGGKAEGLALWRYDCGFWRWERKFSFEGRPGW